MGKGRAAIAAAVVMMLAGCVHDSEASRQFIEVAGGIVYFGATAFQVFLLVP